MDLNKVRKIIRASDFTLGFFSLVFIVFVLWTTWGKMPMGDGTTEITYGLMIRSGSIPYNDFFMHIMPVTSYFSALIEKLPTPIHIFDFIGVLNLAGASLVLGFILRRLSLPQKVKIASFAILTGFYTTTLISYNHHSFDVVLSGCTVLALIALLQSREKKQIYLYSLVAAFCSALIFFITQHIGLAMLLLGPAVLLFDWLFNKNTARVFPLVSLAIGEIVATLVFLAVLALSGVSIQKMLNTTLFNAYGKYTSTYGNWSLWKDAANNVKGAYEKRILKNKTTPATNVADSTDNTEVQAGTLRTNNILHKIFIGKSGIIYTVFNLLALAFILFNAAHFIGLVVKLFWRKEAIEPLIMIWGGSVFIFILASAVTFQVNFSGFYYIFPLWIYVINEYPFRLSRAAANTALITFGVVGALLVISNLFVLGYEYKTREYLTSRIGNEKVWLSPLIFHDFVAQINSVASIVESKQFASASFDAYPRATEIFYLLGKTPKKGTPLFSFFDTRGDYLNSVDAAVSSDVVVIFEPKFYSDELGSEHEEQMARLQPYLNKDFTEILSSKFFKVYKKFSYGK